MVKTLETVPAILLKIEETWIRMGLLAQNSMTVKARHLSRKRSIVEIALLCRNSQMEKSSV